MNKYILFSIKYDETKHVIQSGITGDVYVYWVSVPVSMDIKHIMSHKGYGLCRECILNILMELPFGWMLKWADKRFISQKQFAAEQRIGLNGS